MTALASAQQGGSNRAFGLAARVGTFSVGSLACIALGCAGVGVLAGVNPTYGVVAALGIAFVAIVIGDITVGLLLFTVLSFLDVLRSSGASASFMKIAGLLLFCSWVARTSTRNRRSVVSLAAVSPAIVVAGIALVAWSAISIAWAESTGSAVSGTYRYLLNLLLLPIVFSAVRRREHVFWIAAAFVIGAVISAFYGFVHPLATTGLQAGRVTGTVGDANDQAAVLVGAIALAFGLVGVLRRAPMLRLLAILAVFISLVSVVNTLSRSGLIALAAMLIAAVAVGGRWRRWAALLLVVVSVLTVGYFVAIASSTATARVTSSDTSGRSTIWTIGWRMVQANPLIGVGSNNFQTASIHYLQAPGAVTRADLIVNTPKVAHNIFLEVLADMGIPGLLAFLGVVAASVATAMRAAKAFQRSGDDDLELMSRCVVLAIVGFMVSDFFLSGEFSKQLWLLLAMGPALLALARARGGSHEEGTGTEQRSVRSLPPAAYARTAPSG